jgi:hypothetical protein
LPQSEERRRGAAPLAGQRRRRGWTPRSGDVQRSRRSRAPLKPPSPQPLSLRERGLLFRSLVTSRRVWAHPAAATTGAPQSP